MRKLLLCCAVVCMQAGSLFAEPLVLEQAGNVLQKGALEAGLSDISYQSDETKITNTAGTVLYTLTRTVLNVPIYARYAFTPAIEAFVTLPYSSINYKSELAGTSTSVSDSGLADPTFSGKYSIVYKGWGLAAAAAFTVPMGKESTDAPSSFKRGFNIKPLLAARKGLGDFVINTNLSYAINGEYTDESKIKQKFGDVLSIGAGAEYPIKCCNTLTLIGEAVFNSIGESKVNSVAQSDSSGSQYGIILGSRYTKGDLKAKFGLDISLGDEQYRDYDYRVIAGVTYLVNL